MSGSRITLAVSAAALALAGSAHAATFNVANPNDSGAGSLRQAILDANANPDADTINVGARTIDLLSALPQLTTAMTIDGASAATTNVKRKSDAATNFRIFHVNAGSAAVTLSDMTIADGRATGGAGIISESPLTMDHLIVSGNIAQLDDGPSQGGGAAVFANTTITDTRFTNNQAADIGLNFSQGAGLWMGVPNDAAATVLIDRSTFDANTASDNGNGSFGGGIYACACTTGTLNVTMTRSTISGNSAATGGFGGAIYTESTNFAISDSTIAGNAGTATIQGGGGGTKTLRNTIVADPVSASATCSANFTSLGFNLYEGTGCPSIASDTVGDPKLSALAANGGATPTHAIPGDSPAFDAGQTTVTDQRGQARPADAPGVANAFGGNGADIGAYEAKPESDPPQTSFQSTPPTPSGSDAFIFTLLADEPASGFLCSLDGGSEFGCSKITSVDNQSDGSHTFTARAIDVWDNTDATAATVTWTVNVEPQTVLGDTPAAVSNDPTPTFSFTSSRAGTFRCTIDGGVPFTCATPYTAEALPDGQHTFTVAGRNTQGKDDATPASYTWTIDTAGPESSIDSGPPASTTATTAAFTFSSPEPGATFECKLDAGAAEACTSPKTYTGLGVGAHTFTVTALDAAGNPESTPSVRAWTITTPPVVTPVPSATPTPTVRPAPSDITPPNTRITRGPRSTRSRRPKFSFTSTESGSLFLCKVDSGRYRLCRSGRALKTLRRGRHTLRVVAVDRAGNVDPTPAKRTFRIKK